MKKYIEQLGYKFTTNNDLKNRQFAHFSTDIGDDEELSTMGKKRFITTEIFTLFLRDYDALKFKIQMFRMFNNLYDSELISSDVIYPSNREENKIYITSDIKRYITSDNKIYIPNDLAVNPTFYLLESYEITAEKQENGSELTLTFIIRGD